MIDEEEESAKEDAEGEEDGVVETTSQEATA